MITFAIGESRLDIDLLVAEKALRNIEATTGTRVIDGTIQPTERLLAGICQWLAARGLTGCTPTAAWQFWWAVYERIDQLKARFATQAEIAFWFKINPFELTDEQRIGLLANMDRVKAQSTLHAGNFPATDYRYVYSLTLLATGDEGQAQRARAQALEAFVDAKMARGR